MRIYIFRPLFSSYYVAYHSISHALICGGQRIQTFANVVRLQIKFDEMITSKRDIFPAKSIYYRILYVVDLIFFAPDKKYIKVRLRKKNSLLSDSSKTEGYLVLFRLALMPGEAGSCIF